VNHIDYFTRREFAAYMGDKGHRWPDVRIDNAQAEVIERLEGWAHCAWPNVDVVLGTGSMTLAGYDLTLTEGEFDPLNDEGRPVRVMGAGAAGAVLETTIGVIANATTATLANVASTAITGTTVLWGDGDGTAAEARSRTDIFDGLDLWVLRGIPVIDIASITWDAEPIESYTLYRDRGHIVFGSDRYGLRLGEVAFTYGYTTCPPSVKRACMQATKGLLQSYGEGGSRLPPNVREYTTENTTFVLDESKSPEREPWPWDADANRAIASYWGPNRPSMWVSV
jgi:hypothetical protein